MHTFKLSIILRLHSYTVDEIYQMNRDIKPMPTKNEIENSLKNTNINFIEKLHNYNYFNYNNDILLTFYMILMEYNCHIQNVDCIVENEKFIIELRIYTRIVINNMSKFKNTLTDEIKYISLNDSEYEGHNNGWIWNTTDDKFVYGITVIDDVFID